MRAELVMTPLVVVRKGKPWEILLFMNIMVLGAQVISFHYRTQGLATDGGGNGGIVGYGNGFPGKNNSGGGGGGGVSLTSFVVISLIIILWCRISNCILSATTQEWYIYSWNIRRVRRVRDHYNQVQ